MSVSSFGRLVDVHSGDTQSSIGNLRDDGGAGGEVQEEGLQLGGQF